MPPANVWSLLDEANVVFFGRDALPDGPTTDRLNRDFRQIRAYTAFRLYLRKMTRATKSRASTRGQRVRGLAPLVGLWLAVAAYYVFVISAGHFTRWHVWSAFYDAQAEGILHGHLYLPEAPSRALMALTNPYDLANMPFWRWDHSYYQGHLYLYWGLVPAFIAAAIKSVFHAPGVPDNALTFAFCMIRLVAGTLLIRDVARTAARRPPRWAVAPGDARVRAREPDALHAGARRHLRGGDHGRRRLHGRRPLVRLSRAGRAAGGRRFGDGLARRGQPQPRARGRHRVSA